MILQQNISTEKLTTKHFFHPNCFRGKEKFRPKNFLPKCFFFQTAKKRFCNRKNYDQFFFIQTVCEEIILQQKQFSTKRNKRVFQIYPMVNILIKDCCILLYRGVWSTHVEMQFVSSLVYDGFGQNMLKYIFVSSLAWEMFGQHM